MLLNLRDALQHIISSGESPRSPEWESQHLNLSDVMSTMDNIASSSLTQMTSDRGDLRLAFQTLDDMEPQNEFQAAMAQYARASLQLLESLGGVSTSSSFPEAPSTIIPGLGDPSTLMDESKINLLQSLSEYTDSRATMATYTSFPSTPFSETHSLLRSLTLSQTPQDTSPINSEGLSMSRPSMSSRHLGHMMSLTNSSPLSTPVTYDAASQILQTSNTYYEPLSEMSTECPSTVVQKTENPVNGNGSPCDPLEVEDPSESHDQNTALCKALALQALTDLNVTPKPSANNSFPKFRPLGGSSSFRLPKSSTKPALPRRYSLNGDPLYMSYKVTQTPPKLSHPPIRKNPVPPRKPARQFSTKSSRRSCTTMDSVKALEYQQNMSARNSGNKTPSRALMTESAQGSASNGSNPPKHFSFIDKTKSLINRARFGSRNNKKKESTNDSLKIDPTKDKSKTL